MNATVYATNFNATLGPRFPIIDLDGYTLP